MEATEINGCQKRIDGRDYGISLQETMGPLYIYVIYMSYIPRRNQLQDAFLFFLLIVFFFLFVVNFVIH